MTSKQIKDLIRNKAKKNNINAQILLRNYMLERLMETIISRGILNTRMRDFYDLHILRVLQSDNIDRSLLAEAFKATSTKRGLVFSFENILSELDKVIINPEINRLWVNYRKKFSYAADLEWDEVVVSLKICLTQYY